MSGYVLPPISNGITAGLDPDVPSYINSTLTFRTAVESSRLNGRDRGTLLEQQDRMVVPC